MKNSNPRARRATDLREQPVRRREPWSDRAAVPRGVRAPVAGTPGKEVIMENTIVSVVAVALLIYLFVALIRPEIF